MNVLGRPTDFTQELADLICKRLSSGQSLRAICRDENFPEESTVRNWAVTDYKGFFAQYSRARQIQAEGYVDEIFEISDDGTNDWMERRSEAEKGAGVDTGWVLNGEHIQRSRLRVDSRKWFASKVLPKVYGEKITQEQTGPDGGPIQTVTSVVVTIVDPKTD